MAKCPSCGNEISFFSDFLSINYDQLYISKFKVPGRGAARNPIICGRCNKELIIVNRNVATLYFILTIIAMSVIYFYFQDNVHGFLYLGVNVGSFFIILQVKENQLN